MNPNDHSAAPKPAVPLAAALRDAAASLQQALPPPDVKARVMAAAQAAAAAAPGAQPVPAAGIWPRLFAGRRAVPAADGPAPRAPHGGRWAWSGAAACAVVLAGSALLMVRVPPQGQVDDGLRLGSAGGGFLPLVPPERWPQEAAAAWLVSTELPGERLAALGLPYDPAHAGDSVRAELLLHPSGEVLAVRFLH